MTISVLGGSQSPKFFPICIPIHNRLTSQPTSLVIEHDGSLSRNDVYFGDNHSFNETIWDTVAAYFTEDTIDVTTAAKARAARLEAAKSVNPEYDIGVEGTVFSLVETALYLSVFNNGSSNTAVTEWVNVMFRKFIHCYFIIPETDMLCLLYCLFPSS